MILPDFVQHLVKKFIFVENLQLYFQNSWIVY